MKIQERIATKILEEIEDLTKNNFTEKQYLELEQMVGNVIKEEISKWLGWDTDLQEFEE